jgi:hypothetical protein
MYDQPSYVWALVLAAAIGIPTTTSIVLYRGALAVGLDRRAATVLAVAASAALGAWLVLTALLARAGVYQGRDGGPWFGAAFAGLLIALLLATRTPLVARVLADPGATSRLALPHTLRVVGVVFVILMAQGHLPAAFALPAGLGDIAVGLAAPFVARRLAREPHNHHTIVAAARFNVLGLFDLILALALGVLLGPPWLFSGTPSTEALRLLPLALIPTAAVPLAIALHIVSLARLRMALIRTNTSATTIWSPQSSGETVPSSVGRPTR